MKTRPGRPATRVIVANNPDWQAIWQTIYRLIIVASPVQQCVISIQDQQGCRDPLKTRPGRPATRVIVANNPDWQAIWQPIYRLIIVASPVQQCVISIQDQQGCRDPVKTRPGRPATRVIMANNPDWKAVWQTIYRLIIVASPVQQCVISIQDQQGCRDPVKTRPGRPATRVIVANNPDWQAIWQTIYRLIIVASPVQQCVISIQDQQGCRDPLKTRPGRPATRVIVANNPDWQAIWRRYTA